MARYIDADALKEKKIYSAERHEYIVPVAVIDWLPTADVVPKSKVAREIFAEIEQIIENSKYRLLNPFGTEERYNPYLIKKQIAELKKKYTEDQT